MLFGRMNRFNSNSIQIKFESKRIERMQVPTENKKQKNGKK